MSKQLRKKNSNKHMSLVNGRVVVGNNEKRIKPKWSFVRGVSAEYSDPEVVNGVFFAPKFTKGVGMFRCLQTGDLIEMPYLNHVKQPIDTKEFWGAIRHHI